MAEQRLFALEPRRRGPLVSLTALIDVVFILLIFFMLASSFDSLRRLELASGMGGGRDGLEGSMLVDIGVSGLRLSGETLPLEAVAERIAARLATRPDLVVLLRPGEGVNLQRTIDVVDRLNARGVRKLTLLGPDPG